MRTTLEKHYLGKRLYLFTTQGHVHSGTLVDLIDEVVDLLSPDGETHVYINLSDVSGVRGYDQDEETPP